MYIIMKMLPPRPVHAALLLVLTLLPLSAHTETLSLETEQALAVEGLLPRAAALRAANAASPRPAPRAAALRASAPWLKIFRLQPTDPSKPRRRLAIEAFFEDGFALRWLHLTPKDGDAYEVSYGTQDGAYNASTFEKRPFSIQYAYRAPSGIYHRTFVTSTWDHRFDHTGLETVLVHPSRNDDYSARGKPSIGIRVDGVVSYQWSDGAGGFKELRLLPGGGMVEFETPIRFAESGRLPPPTEGELSVSPSDELMGERCSLAEEKCRDRFERLVQRWRFDR